MTLWSLSVFFQKRVRITHVNMIITDHVSSWNGNIALFGASPAPIFLKVYVAVLLHFDNIFSTPQLSHSLSISL